MFAQPDVLERGEKPLEGDMALKVVYEKEGVGVWLVFAPSVRGCHTHGKSVLQARERIREALGLFRNDAATVAFEEEFKLSADLEAMVRAFLDKKAAAAKAQADAQLAARKAAAALKRKTFTVRDSGEVLSLSHQRVQQLLEA